MSCTVAFSKQVQQGGKQTGGDTLLTGGCEYIFQRGGLHGEVRHHIKAVPAAIDLLCVSWEFTHHCGHPGAKQLEKLPRVNALGIDKGSSVKEAGEQTIHAAEKSEVV